MPRIVLFLLALLVPFSSSQALVQRLSQFANETTFFTPVPQQQPVNAPLVNNQQQGSNQNLPFVACAQLCANGQCCPYGSYCLTGLIFQKRYRCAVPVNPVELLNSGTSFVTSLAKLGEMAVKIVELIVENI